MNPEMLKDFQYDKDRLELRQEAKDEIVMSIVSKLEELIKNGADSRYIALGLAGVGTPESMELRERLINRGYVDYVAEGLAGVGTPESMALRERIIEMLIKERVGINSVAQGLAGANTPEANQFREKYFSNDPTLYAESYTLSPLEIKSIICRYGYEK